MNSIRIKPLDDVNSHEDDMNSNEKKEKKQEEMSSLLWRTFVGNKKKEDFFKSAHLMSLVLIGLLVFFLYSQKTQKSVYVIDEGAPKLASLVDSDVRVDEQVHFFVKLWTKLLIEVNSTNYAENRETLKSLSSQDLMKRILSSEGASGNRLLKEVIQTETMRLKVADVVIESIERRGSIINVRFTEIIQIDLPDGSERYATDHNAELITASYSLNGLGMVMVDLDNLWKLERRIE